MVTILPLRKSIIRLFADDTKMSAKIKTEEDIEKLQQDLEKVYNWAEENLMEFNEGKFEQMSHGHTENVREGTYKTKLGKEIKPKKKVKDLGVRDEPIISDLDRLSEYRRIFC